MSGIIERFPILRCDGIFWILGIMQQNGFRWRVISSVMSYWQLCPHLRLLHYPEAQYTLWGYHFYIMMSSSKHRLYSNVNFETLNVHILLIKCIQRSLHPKVEYTRMYTLRRSMYTLTIAIVYFEKMHCIHWDTKLYTFRYTGDLKGYGTRISFVQSVLHSDILWCRLETSMFPLGR